jgi:P4 family phage/plasmid primase-like protien
MDVEDPVDKVMREKGVDREAAYGLVKDREERKMIEERHTGIVIPKQLQDPVFRFIKIRMHKQGDKDPCWRKAPLETGWRKDRNYAYTDDEILDWIKAGNNYGVALGYGNLCVIDCDTEELEKIATEKLPRTFTIRTGGGRVHLYYLCSGHKSTSFDGANKKHYGEYKSTGVQVVAPGSIHPSGNRYVVERDEPIASLDYDSLLKVLPKDIKIIEQKADKEYENIYAIKYTVDWNNEAMKKLIPRDSFKRKGDELRGPHPSHGSKRGENISYEMNDNVWMCFHHHHGGNIVELIAITEGIVTTCGDKITKEQYDRAEKIAKEKYGVSTPKIKLSSGREIDERELMKKYGVITTTKKGTKLICPRLAELIYTEYGLHFITADKTIYTYNGTHYVPNGEQIIRQHAQRLLGTMSYEKAKDETVGWIRDHDGPKTTDDVFDKAPANLINIKNGVFDITTKTLLPPDPKYRFLSVLPVSYNKNAKPGRLLQFFMEIAPDSVETIQEMIGYSLYRKQALQKAFVLIGSGRNGKSKLIAVIKHLVGIENTSTIELQQMKDKHYRAELHGKLLNVVGDLSNRDVKEENSSVFKMLIGEDYVEARRMYGHPFSFTSSATNIFSCNVLPKFEDCSDGLLRRFITIPFFNIFEKGKPGFDDDILDKLLTQEETEWLFGWAVDGLLRAIKNKSFTGTKSIEEMGEMFDEMASPTAAFIRSCCDTNEFGDIPKADFFVQLGSWCKNRLPMPNSRQVRQDILNYFPYIKEVKSEDEKGKRNRSWGGISWSRFWKDRDQMSQQEIIQTTVPIIKGGTEGTGLSQQNGHFSPQKQQEGIPQMSQMSPISIVNNYLVERETTIEMLGAKCGDICANEVSSPVEENKKDEKQPGDICDICAASDTVSHIVVETSHIEMPANDMPQHDRIAEVRNYVLRTQPVTMVALLDHFEPDAFIYDLIQRGLLVRVPDKTFEKYEWMKD